jgi:hypothetical protein
MQHSQQHMPSPAQLSYFHYQQPQQPRPPPQPHYAPQPQQQYYYAGPPVDDFEAYVPEPVNPLRAALDAAERQQAKAERLSGALSRVLETLVTETRTVGSGISPTLERLLAAPDGVFTEVLAMQREWDATAKAVASAAHDRRLLQQRQQPLLLHELEFPQGVDYFGSNEPLVFRDPSSGELCLRAP